MASTRMAPQAQIGSAQWIQDEQVLADQYIEQEVEDFTFSVSNEVEWLNAHMADVFNRGQFDVVEAFKTPGKLRGKTPRTLKRVNAIEDEPKPATIFAQPPPAFKLLPNPVQTKSTAFDVAEDINDDHVASPPIARFSMGAGKENSRVSVSRNNVDSRNSPTPVKRTMQVPRLDMPDTAHVQSPAEAREITMVEMSEDEEEGQQVEVVEEDVQMEDIASPVAPTPKPTTSPARALEQDTGEEEEVFLEADLDVDEEDLLAQEPIPSSQPASPSESSTPVKSMLRKKSSLTFATLPVRDPITTKKSIGPRLSRLSHDQTRPFAGRSSHLGTNGSADGDMNVDAEDEAEAEVESDEEVMEPIKENQSKTSTQILHEKFAMLGKTGQTRLSKSIPSFVAQAQEKAAAKKSPEDEKHQDENDDDWIGPISSAKHSLGLDKTPLGFAQAAAQYEPEESPEKSARATRSKDVPQAVIQTVAPEQVNPNWTLASPASRLPVVSYPRLVPGTESTTPAGSPVRSKIPEGTMSTSKNKLFLVLKSAKGLFGGSSTPRAEVPEQQPVSPKQRPTIQRVASQPDAKQLPVVPRSTRETRAQKEPKQHPVTVKPSRRSSERLANLKSSVTEVPAQEITNTGESEELSSGNDMAPPPPPKSMLPTSQIQKPGELRRPLRAGTRPAPVSIKLASQRIIQPGASTQEAIPVPASSLRPPTLTKKASSNSIQTTSSNQSWKTASSTARPKALDAAARKREQEEQQAQRRAEQKKELERKRAAKQEEERKAAQELEQKKALEAKNASQRQAAEQRRADAIRRNEQLRERAAAKAEAPLKRPLIRTNTVEDVRAAPVMNTTKPAKRQYDEDDEDDEEPTRQTSKQEPKRRRTSQMEANEGPSRPTMAPPIRPSNAHKEKYNIHSYMATSTTTAPSIFKQTVTTQHNLAHAPKTPHYNDFAKYSSAKVPFAEAPNPPGGAVLTTSTSQKVPLARAGAIAPAKTPGTTKPSPKYPNGNDIELPDIQTDSESDDDDNDPASKDFIPPSWANSPALRDLLRQQQLVDPMAVFGPIAPLVMEEVFQGNKERQARFRNRTSSAVWTRDMLTQEEVVRDRLARERLEREGGWSFRPGTNSGL